MDIGYSSKLCIVLMYPLSFFLSLYLSAFLSLALFLSPFSPLSVPLSLFLLSSQKLCGTNYPVSISFIVVNEFCERFSYYGMKGIVTYN